jgi:hypothetical protein
MPFKLGYFLRPVFEFACVGIALTGILALITTQCQAHSMGAIACAGISFISAYLIGGIIASCLPSGRLALDEFTRLCKHMVAYRLGA